MKLLKVRHRLARLTVLDQREVASLNPVTPTEGVKEPASKTNLLTKVEFTEVNENGQPIGQPKQFDIVGDMVYVDYLNVTFDDKFIEEADLDRSTSLALFQRIFGEHQEPVEGFQLDTVGTRPTAYGAEPRSRSFEKKIWDDFWLIANDPKRAAELGIRAANGEAVSIRVRPGMTYEIDLRATGGMTIRPLSRPCRKPTRRAAISYRPSFFQIVRVAGWEWAFRVSSGRWRFAELAEPVGELIGTQVGLKVLP